MLKALSKANAVLPKLLREHPSTWQSLDVLYHPPRVERVWRQWGDYRLCLHIIHSCTNQEALFHPHPWPSAMRILQGQYSMSVGYGAGTQPPAQTQTKVHRAGQQYAMEDPDEWHSVWPDDQVATVMLSGKPWQRAMPEYPTPGKNVTLSSERKDEILKLFQSFYPLDSELPIHN
eukprot:g63865.t1